MEPRRIRRIPSLGLSLHRLTAAAHQSPLQAKCNLIRGKLRRARSNAPQRFEASSWASCRTTADASSFCESRAERHICRTSSTQMSRSRVTFVIFPATTEQHGERNFVRTVISFRRLMLKRPFYRAFATRSPPKFPCRTFEARRHLCPARALAVGFAVASGDLPSGLRPSAHAPSHT